MTMVAGAHTIKALPHIGFHTSSSVAPTPHAKDPTTGPNIMPAMNEATSPICQAPRGGGIFMDIEVIT